MTDTKPRKLAHEILGMIGLSAALCLILFLVLSGVATAIAEEYFFQHDIPMTEFDWIRLDRLICGASALLACVGFSVLFLCLIGDRIAYIRTITDRIRTLQDDGQAAAVPTEGNNELTALAQTVNTVSAARRQIRAREQALADEREQLIHALSHDIRTPLTSILAYTDYLQDAAVTPDERQAYLALIRRKGEQIRDLTAVLLDGTRREAVHFADAGLLFAQMAAAFEEELADRFRVRTDLSACPAFAGCVDPAEMHRIFDNLISNVGKYADPAAAVVLEIAHSDRGLHIRQSNAVGGGTADPDSYGIGLRSIRRIAQHYGGQVSARREGDLFTIDITLTNL